MVRYWVVNGDLASGYDFEYTFNLESQARRKYESINLDRKGVVFKSIYKVDDEHGDIKVDSEEVTI